MPFNSFLGHTSVVKAMIQSPKSTFIANKMERKLFPYIGPLAIRIFGWPLWLEGRLVARVVHRYLLDKKGRLLDLGGSYGVHAFEEDRRGWEVTIIDIDQDNLTLGRKIGLSLRATVSFQYGDVCNTQFSDNEFDAILGIELIEHIKDDAQVIEEMHRILKPGGLLILATPYADRIQEYAYPKIACQTVSENIPSDVFVGGGHWRNGYNEGSMIRLLENHGFSVEDTTCIRFPRLLPKLTALFPVTYPIAWLISPFSQNRVGLVVKARK